MDNDTLAIDLHDVQKRFGRKIHALRGVEMQVSSGEIFGLLGPNGAGKSTLVKIMLSVVRPTFATGTILGKPVGSKGSLLKIGYLPEHLRFPPYLTGLQALDYFASLSRIPRRQRRRPLVPRRYLWERHRSQIQVRLRQSSAGVLGPHRLCSAD